MTVAIIVLAACLVAVVLVLSALLVRSRLDPGPPLTSKTVWVHTREDRTIRGVLIGQHADRVTLREAAVVHKDGETPAGLVHIPIGQIHFMQEIEPPERAGE